MSHNFYHHFEQLDRCLYPTLISPVELPDDEYEEPNFFNMEFEAIVARDSLDPSFHLAFMDLSNFDWTDHPPRRLTSRSDLPDLLSNNNNNVGRQVVEGTVNPRDVFPKADVS